LVLQGLQRVRFTSFERENPFPIANIETVESRDAPTVETEALGAKVIELYGSLKHDHRQLPAKLDQYLSELRDLEMLADLMASTFVSDPLRRQRLLEERSLNQRLRFLIRYLRDEIGNAAA
jgi:ATP-dependent Lon protease